MTYPISLELIEDVFETVIISYDINKKIIITYPDIEDSGKQTTSTDIISFDSFFFKCKDYMANKGWRCSSSVDGTSHVVESVTRESMSFKGINEKHSVFLAAEWVRQYGNEEPAV